MAEFHAALLFAIAVGFVSSGLIGNLWAVLTDEEPRLSGLFDHEPGLRTPFRIMVIIFSAPTSLMVDGCGWLIAQPAGGILIVLLALGWSLMQGTFILTQIFGLL